MATVSSPSLLLLPHSFHHSSFHQNSKLSLFSPPSAGKVRRIRIDRRFSFFKDQRGGKSDPNEESPAEVDPKESTLSTDEWGEKTELATEIEAEEAAADEDERGNGSPAAAAVAAEDEVGELKRCLVDAFNGTELGFRDNADVRGEIFELVSELEAKNPTIAPNEAREILDGKWILL